LVQEMGRITILYAADFQYLSKVRNLLYLLPSFLLISLLFAGCTSKPNTIADKDMLQVPGPINLISSSYILVRTLHPTADSYIQEYVHGNEDPDHFTEMIRIELMLHRTDTREIAVSQAKEIQNRKNSDPFAEYNIGEDSTAHEMLLDYQFSEGKDDQAMAEWNICRYKLYSDAKGNSGYTVFRWVRRSYGRQYETVPDQLSNHRMQYVRPFMQLAYPKVQLK
jgi:hypothetical protein